MNKRIEKLSIEANSQTGNEFDLNHKPLDAFLAKFAELIVQECAKRCEELGKPELGLGLMKHFGVEK
jgi:hypothetical protein